MKIVLHSYDDTLTVTTSMGTSIHIRPVEVKKQLGVAGTTDQIEVSSALPVKVGKPFLSGANENWDKPELPDTREHVVRMLFGKNRRDEVPLVDGYWDGGDDDNDDDDDDDDEKEEWALELEDFGLGEPAKPEEVR